MTDEVTEIAAAYDALASDYDNLYPDVDSAAELSYETLTQLLPALRRTSRVLDCACGTGVQCVTLAEHGHHVQASDASSGMLRRATERFRTGNLQIPTTRCTWTELPAHFGPGNFDVVICWGNSIAHCGSRSTLVASLRGMRTVLADGGTLAVQTRDWERLLLEKPRYTVGSVLHHGDHRVIPLYIWDLHGMWERSSVEIVFLELVADVTHHRSHTLPMWPVPSDDLTKAAYDAGFAAATRHTLADGGWYAMTAEKR